MLGILSYSLYKGSMFACLVCGNNKIYPSIRGYVECRLCNTLVAQKIPAKRETQKRIEKHSRNIIHEQRSDLIDRDYAERLRRLERYIKPGAKILDVGCGSGSFLSFVSSRGYRASGYDISRKLTRHLRSLGISCYTDRHAIPNGYFDAITSFDVIEHNNDPYAFIREITPKLKKNGVLMLTTPNAFGISGSTMRNRWWVFSPEGHLVLFSPGSLAYVLKREGYAVLSLTTDTFTPWFMPIYKLRNKIFNKIVYLCAWPFKHILFQQYLGDNIEIIASNVI